MLMMSSTTVIFLALMLITNSTPLTMGINIMLLAISSMLVLLMVMSSWYALMMFLIYIGAMLVMFAYFMAILPNNKIEQKNTMSFIMLLSVMLAVIILSKNHPISFLMSNSTNSSAMFKINNFMIFIIIILILLYTMIIIMKITQLNYGPVRMFKYV